VLGRLGAAAGWSASRVSALGSRAVLAGLDTAISSDLAAHAVDRVVASPLAQRAVTRALAGPVAAAVDGEDAERLAAQVIQSRVLDVAVERLLESEDMWLLVEEIIQSPTVTEAIGQQGLGFADQLADVVRERSGTADARVERVARRLLRRPPRSSEPVDRSPAALDPTAPLERE
jgi:hypothetical protein